MEGRFVWVYKYNNPDVVRIIGKCRCQLVFYRKNWCCSRSDALSVEFFGISFSRLGFLLQVSSQAPTETAVTALLNEQPARAQGADARRQRPTAFADTSAVSVPAAGAVSAASAQSQAKQPTASSSSTSVPYTSTSIASVVKVSSAAAGSSSAVAAPAEPIDPFLDDYNKTRALHEGLCAIWRIIFRSICITRHFPN